MVLSGIVLVQIDLLCEVEDWRLRAQLPVGENFNEADGLQC
jgi:hypothetical protein